MQIVAVALIAWIIEVAADFARGLRMRGFATAPGSPVAGIR